MNNTHPMTRIKMKPTIANVKRVAAKHGATVDVSDAGRRRVINIYLPKGRAWNANGLHFLTTMDFEVWDHVARDAGHADLIQQMEYGTCECDDPECEHCH